MLKWYLMDVKENDVFVDELNATAEENAIRIALVALGKMSSYDVKKRESFSVVLAKSEDDSFPDLCSPIKEIDILAIYKGSANNEK